MKKVFVLFFFVFYSSIFAQIKVDSLRYKRAQKAPKTLDVKYLAQFLKAGANSDEKTIETFYYWIHQNIEYDVQMMKKGSVTEADVAVLKTLKNKKTVCSGYSNLMFQLCQAVNIECVVIEGVAQLDDETSDGSHAWNAVKINGNWKLIDVTWGSGGLFGETYQKQLSLLYLFSKNEEFVLEHFPDEEKWQLLDKPISKKEFSSVAWIKKRKSYFQSRIINIYN